MNDPRVLYEISGARSTEAAQLALQRHDVPSVPSDEAVHAAKKETLKSMCKALGLRISGTMPILRRRILEFKTASAVPARLPVPQEPPEDLSPAPPIIPAIPPRMSPPSSSDENSSDSDTDGNAGLNKGPKTRKTKGRKRKDEAYKKRRELKRLRQSITVSCCLFCYT